MKERIHQLETCFKITSLLNSELNLSRLLDTIMKNAKKIMKGDACSLMLLDKETDELVIQIALSQGASRIVMKRFKVGEGIAGAVVKTGRSRIVKDVYKHPSFNPKFDRISGFKTGSLLCAPLKADGNIIGVCEVIHRRGKGKVFSRGDLALFRLFCDCAAIAIEKARIHEIILENHRHEQEIKFARSTQESFLPETPPEHSRYVFAAKTLPAKFVGGDYYDFIRFDADTLAIVLGDVSGKGVHAALQMARLMSDFRHLSRIDPDPGKVMNEINNILCERSSRGMFSTAIYLLLDMKKRRMRIANAGHPALLIRDKRKTVTEIGKAGGPPLGIVPNTVYGQEMTVLKQGDRVLLYSDGLTEPKNTRNEGFGLNRLRALFQNDESPPQETITIIEKVLRRFIGAAPQFDDQTCVIFQAL